MYKRLILHPAVGLMFSLWLICGGILAAFAPWAPEIRDPLIRLLTEGKASLTLAGLGSFAIGTALLRSYLRHQKAPFYKVQGGDREISVEPELIGQYVRGYFLEHFPQQKVGSQISIQNNRIEVIADMELHPSEALKVEREIAQQLEAILGYSEPLELAVRKR